MTDKTPRPDYSTLPTLDDVDVLVAGGGPAGIGAAVGAARHGARTLVIENHSFFGGVGAWMQGMSVNQMRPKGRARSAVHELVWAKIMQWGQTGARVGVHQLWCNAEYFKVAILDVFDSAGVQYLVQIRAVDTIVENSRVIGVVVATKRGPMRIGAKAVVDCTGDADVSYYAGAQTMLERGSLGPGTLGSNYTNARIDQIALEDLGEAAAKASAKYPLIPPGGWALASVAHTTFCWVNFGGTKFLGQFDPTDPRQRTQAECLSRRQIIQMAQAMREYATNPELKNIELCGVGAQTSFRESRRVLGGYVLTEEDAFVGAQFPDTIAWRSGPMDVGFHAGDGAAMKIHDVPYRALVPEKIDGLLVAGRSISATHIGAACGKSMGNCMATGHAAGVAGALAAKKASVPRNLAVKDIQNALKDDGVDLFPKDREQDPRTFNNEVPPRACDYTLARGRR
jgi:ribulose 1,5-bisphosphate synthetase/thiazole synthase